MSEAHEAHRLRGQVNRSGFQFQVRLAQEVRDGSHNWRVIVEEHPWDDRESGIGGFIDIVLEKPADFGRDQPRIRMVVECKKVGDETDWVFLVPDLKLRRGGVRLLDAYLDQQSFVVEWRDKIANPLSSESAFCVVPKGRQTLEKLCDTLLPSVECLAHEGLTVDTFSSAYGESVFYIPVIVTNARLSICVFHPSNVDIETGELLNGAGQFQSVPFVRFRKALSSTLQPQEVVGLNKANQAGQRTVFVVHSTNLTSFLGGFFLG